MTFAKACFVLCSEDAAIVLRGVPRLLKLLRDAKQNCITHTVRCASRDEGDILHLAQNMERKKGIEKAVEYLQKQLKDASKQQWANWCGNQSLESCMTFCCKLSSSWGIKNGVLQGTQVCR